MHTLRIVTLAVIVAFSRCQELYRIVRLAEKANTYYLLYNNISRLIPDAETVQGLNFKIDDLKSITEAELSAYSMESPAPLMKTDKTADGNTKLYVDRSDLFNGRDIWTFECIGNYINPAVGPFRGRLLMVTPLEFHLATGIGRKKKVATNTIEFMWVNSSDYFFYTNETYLGIGNEIDPLNVDIVGGDPRMIIYNDSYIEIYFAYVLSGYERQKVSVVALRYLEDLKQINVTYMIQPIYDKHIFQGSREKNWIPFEYKNETLLIQSINPFRVMKMVGYGEPHIKAEIYSITHSKYQHYLSGNIRGGSNAIFLPEHGVYFSFYHTKCILMSGNPLDTYTFGAYTFSATPPFKLLSMSVSPIMHPEFYTGAWISRFIDYALYPTHVSLSGDELLMSFGVHDRQGYLARFSLKRLLKTLAPIDDAIKYSQK